MCYLPRRGAVSQRLVTHHRRPGWLWRRPGRQALIRMALDWGYLDAPARLVPLASW